LFTFIAYKSAATYVLEPVSVVYFVYICSPNTMGPKQRWFNMMYAEIHRKWPVQIKAFILQCRFLALRNIPFPRHRQTQFLNNGLRVCQLFFRITVLQIKDFRKQCSESVPPFQKVPSRFSPFQKRKILGTQKLHIKPIDEMITLIQKPLHSITSLEKMSGAVAVPSLCNVESASVPDNHRQN
jgi:hypothetical protein